MTLTVFDIPMFVPAILATIAAVMVFLGGAAIPAKIASVLCALAFTAIPVIVLRWRKRVNAADQWYFGVGIVHGFESQWQTRERLSKDAIARLIFILAKRFTRKVALDALAGARLIIVDREKLSILDRWVRGFASGRDAVCCARGLDAGQFRGLVMHELGHVALTRMGVDRDEELQHGMMGDMGI